MHVALRGGAGGLGDVMSALPKALARRGHRVMVVVPRYENYLDAWETSVRRVYSVFNSQQEVGTGSRGHGREEARCWTGPASVGLYPQQAKFKMEQGCSLLKRLGTPWRDTGDCYSGRGKGS